MNLFVVKMYIPQRLRVIVFKVIFTRLQTFSMKAAWCLLKVKPTHAQAHISCLCLLFWYQDIMFRKLNITDWPFLDNSIWRSLWCSTLQWQCSSGPVSVPSGSPRGYCRSETPSWCWSLLERQCQRQGESVSPDTRAAAAVAATDLICGQCTFWTGVWLRWRPSGSEKGRCGSSWDFGWWSPVYCSRWCSSGPGSNSGGGTLEERKGRKTSNCVWTEDRNKLNNNNNKLK